MANIPKKYVKQYPGFRFSSGIKLTKGGDKGKVTDWTVITDNDQGIAFFQDGVSRIRCHKTSMDICGRSCKEDEPAKIIYAENGDIHIVAEFGDLVLSGRNIRIGATAHDGEVTVVSPKHFQVQAAIQNLKGTNVNILSAQNLQMVATSLESTAGLNHNQTSLVDENKGTFLTKLLSLFGKAKKFLEGDLLL